MQAPPNTPPKFVNRDGTLKAEELVKSYLELEKKFHEKAQGSKVS